MPFVIVQSIWNCQIAVDSLSEEDFRSTSSIMQHRGALAALLMMMVVAVVAEDYYDLLRVSRDATLLVRKRKILCVDDKTSMQMTNLNNQSKFERRPRTDLVESGLDEMNIWCSSCALAHF